METKMNRNNGGMKRNTTCLGAAKFIKEIYTWAQRNTREMKVGESFKVEISVKCCDGWYECSESWETEFAEEEK